MWHGVANFDSDQLLLNGRDALPRWPGQRRAVGILAAEADPDDAEHLLTCLRSLGEPVLLATTPEQVVRLIRHHVPEQAVVGVEMALGDELILTRVSCLPALRCLVATGPAGDPAMEILARSAGADVYLHRPLCREALRMALGLPAAARPAVAEPRGRPP